MRPLRVLGQQVRVRIRPRSAYAPPGPPLVLCNGIGAPLELLTPFVEALPDSMEIVQFDVPGVGGSPLPNVPYTFAGLSILLGRTLNRLGYDRVDLLGISWGGGLAQQFALQNPQRCRRLVLVSTGTGWLMVPARPGVLRKMLSPRRYTDPAWARAVAPELYGGTMRRDPGLVLDLLHGGPRVGRTGYLLQLAAGAGWSTLPWLPLIRQPTLLLAGTDDPLIPMANAKIMRSMLPHAVLHTYDDGHLALVTNAEGLAPVVARFLGHIDAETHRAVATPTG